MIDMRGFALLAGTGLGAMAGVALAAPVFLLSIFLPSAAVWALVPILVCTFAGFVFGLFVEKG